MSTFNKYRLKGAYHYQWYETEDWYRWMVNRAVKFCKGQTLDVGCGDGLLVSKLGEKVAWVYGVDNDIDGLRLAVEKCYDVNVDFKLFNVDEDSLDGQWDYMTCLNVIEHLNRPERLLEIINNNIIKGAIITTIDYQGGSLGEDHKFEWTYDEMMDFFKEFNPKGFRYKDTEWIGVEIRK